MDIEALAVLAVKNEIAKYDFLVDYINTKDKIPMWDGEIYIYNENSKHNSNMDFKGKISVQVKGHKVAKISTGNSKYKIDVEYLRAYQKEKKGVLLLVTEIVNYENKQLFYANLLPVDLAEILKKVKDGQKTITIDIKPIKEKSSSSLKMVCLNFLKNSNEQMNIEIKNIDDINSIEKINFSVVGEEKYLEDYLFNNDIYTYAIEKGTNKKFALSKLKDIEKFSTNKVNISIGTTEYYQQTTFIKNKTEEYVLFGNSTKIFLNENKITFKIKGNIYQRINDINFIIQLIKNKKMLINGKETFVPINIEKQKENKYIKSLEKDLVALNKIKDLFDKFDIKFNIEYDNLTEKDLLNLNRLLKINEGELIDKEPKTNLYYIEIANYKIAFVALLKKDNKLETYNYFSDIYNVLKVFYYDTDKNEIRISPYLNLKKEDLITYSNINTEIIKNSCNMIDSNEATIVRYNLFLLEVLKAYDETLDNKWLELAEHISKKILEYDNQPIHTINNLQILKRKKELTQDEKNILFELREDIKDNMLQCAIAILLENVSDYELYFSKLNNKEQNQFKSFPIYKFIYKKN